MTSSRLLAIRITRRTAAIVVFVDEQIDFVQIHQLSSDPAKAQPSIIGFVRRFATLFDIDSVAVEVVDPPTPTRRVALTRTVVKVFRSDGIPVRECTKHELFDAYAHPPLRTRKELRGILKSFWPALDQGTQSLLLLDATALGLYVQMQRSFIS